MSKRLKIGDFLEAFDAVKQIHQDSDEPIPELGKESLEKVKHILDTPFQEVFGKKLYYGFHTKAAVMLYLMIKNHPLANGNKRMAVVVLGLFYDRNNRSLACSNAQIYDLVMFIVNSPSGAFKKTLRRVKETLKSYD